MFSVLSKVIRNRYHAGMSAFQARSLMLKADQEKAKLK
jgi:hypothetical protein